MRRVIISAGAASTGLLLAAPAWAGVPIPMDGKIDRGLNGVYTATADSQGGGSSNGGGAPSTSAGKSGPGASVRPVILTEEQKAAAKGAGAACTGVTAVAGEVPAACRPVEGGGPAAPRVNVEDVREEATDQIRLSAPDLKASPCLAGGGCKGTVGVPVWLWVGDGSSLPSDSASASAGPYTVNVNAQVRQVEWSLGDGQTTICSGSGTPYDKATHGWSAPECGFEKGWQKAGTYTLTASYVWDVDWSGSVTGSDSQTMSSTQQVTVREIQTTVSSNGS